MSDFEKYKSKLKSALEDKTVSIPNANAIEIKSFKAFVKGDVSGIQDFIFTVRSKGASKSLKSRSHFIGVLTSICIELISEKVGKENFKLVYNGGGNFYGFLKEFKDLSDIQKIIDDELKTENIYLCVTTTRIDDNNFGKIWETAEIESSKSKQTKLKTLDYLEVFKPFEKTPLNSDDWKDFSGRLAHSTGFEIKTANLKTTKISSDSFRIFGKEFKLSNLNKNFEHQISNKLPLKSDGSIKEFNKLAEQAKVRTGTEKLGVLKIDIDNLGLLFKKINTVERAQSTSDCLSWFFNQYFNEMWSEGKFINENKFSENIYPVFAGGDDCFLIGAWDSVFEFAYLLRNKFKEFTNNKLTLSASLLIVDEHFPVIRFVEMAENALKEAKTSEKDKEGNYVKDKISIFGEVLTWEEFEQSRKIALKLLGLIKEKGESRSILARIKNSKIGFEKLQNKALNGVIKAQSVWRLKYYLRNVKKENKEEMDELFNDYARLLLKSLSNHSKVTNPNIFPVAARWAEFLTKNKD